MVEKTERRSRRQKEKFTFADDPLRVAEQLRGARLVFDGEEVGIVHVQGFPKASIKQKIFQEAMQQTPGTLTAVPYRGSLLPNITTKDGGLVMIRAIERTKEDGTTELIAGPGRVASALGLQENEIRRITVEKPKKRILKVH